MAEVSSGLTQLHGTAPVIARQPGNAQQRELRFLQTHVRANMSYLCSMSKSVPTAPAAHENPGSCAALHVWEIWGRVIGSWLMVLPYRRRVAASVKVLPRFWYAERRSAIT